MEQILYFCAGKDCSQITQNPFLNIFQKLL